MDNDLLRFNKIINSIKTKDVLVKNELNKLSRKVEAISTKGLTKDLTNGYKILNGARYFSSGTLQKPKIYFSYRECLRFFNITYEVSSCKAIGLSEKSIENITPLDSNFVSALINYYPSPDIKFDVCCLICNNNDPPLGAVSLYIFLDRWSRNLEADFILGNIKLI